MNRAQGLESDMAKGTCDPQLTARLANTCVESTVRFAVVTTDQIVDSLPVAAH